MKQWNIRNCKHDWTLLLFFWDGTSLEMQLGRSEGKRNGGESSTGKLSGTTRRKALPVAAQPCTRRDCTSPF